MKKKVLIILGSIVLVVLLVFIVTNKAYSANENIVKIDSNVLSNREELSKYASNIAKQYLYKHTLTDYEQYSMDDLEGITSRGYSVVTFNFANSRMEPEKLRNKFYANFDCSQFVQNVYYNAYGYNFLDVATKYSPVSSIIIDDDGIIARRANSMDTYNYANKNLGVAISTAYFEKLAEDDTKSKNSISSITRGNEYKINDSNYITQFYYKMKSGYSETQKEKETITKDVLNTLQNGDLLLMRWDTTKDGNSDGDSDSGHILFYTNDDIYYYSSCDSNNKCSYKVNSTPLKGGFIHSTGNDFKFNKDGVSNFYFDDSYSVRYLPFNDSTTEDFNSALDYLFKQRDNGTYPCTIAILRPLNKIEKGNYTSSLDYNNKTASTRTNTIALNTMSDLKFTQNVAYNSYINAYDYSEVQEVKQEWANSRSTPKYALSNYDSINAGDILEYSLTIENMESTTNTYSLTASADIPDGTEYLSGTCYGNRNVTCSKNNEGTKLTWKNINPKAGKINIAFKVKVKTPSDGQNRQVDFKGINISNGNNNLRMDNIITNVNPSFTYRERQKAISANNKINNFDDNNIYTGTESTVLAKITAIYNDIFDTSLGDISNYKNSIFKDLSGTVKSGDSKLTSDKIVLSGENKIRNKDSNDRISKMLVTGLWGGRRVRGNITHDRTSTFNVANLVIGDIILGTTGSNIDQAVIYLGISSEKDSSQNTNYQLIYYDKKDNNIKFLTNDGSTARKIIANTINSDTFVVLRPSQVISKEIIFDTKTDEKIPYTLVTKGSTYGELPSPKDKKGYTFKGWYKSDDTNKILLAKNTKVSSLKSFITVVPKYTANTYVVDFNTNGGNTISSKNVTYDSTYGTLETPTKTGYDFAGWYLDQELTKKVESNTTIDTSSNHTLYAKWNAKTIKVSFETNSGNIIEPIEVTYNGTYGTLPEPTKENYTFEGWYLEQDLINKVENNTPVKTSSDHTLYAKYNGKKYNLTIDSNGGNYNGDTNIDLVLGTNYTLKAPTREGYTFVEWQVTGNNSSISEDLFTMGTENSTAKAIWKANKYTVVYSSDTELDKESVEVTYDSAYGTLAVPQKVGYTFIGWYLEDTYENRVDSSTIVKTSKSHILYAKYEVNKYKLTIDLNNGTYPEDIELERELSYNETINLTTPTREGYIFTEWSIDNDKAKINNNIFIMKDSDTKITANWKKSEIEPYLITDISIDGTTIDNFDTNILNYNLLTEKEEITITVKTNNTAAKVDYPKEQIKLDYGINIIKLILTTREEKEVIYTLNINRKDLRSSDNYLNSIKLFDKNIELNTEETKYVIDVEDNISVLKISDIKYSDKTTIKFKYNDKEVNPDNLNTQEIKEGLNYLVINVVAENTDEREYTFIINKKIIEKDNVDDIKNVQTGSKLTYILIALFLSLAVILIYTNKEKIINKRVQ